MLTFQPAMFECMTSYFDRPLGAWALPEGTRSTFLRDLNTCMNMSAESRRQIKAVLFVVIVAVAEANKVQQDFRIRTRTWKSAGPSSSTPGSGSKSSVHNTKLEEIVADPNFREQAQLVEEYAKLVAKDSAAMALKP